MKNNFNYLSLSKNIRYFFRRYHNILYFIIIAGFLMFTILSIITIINNSGRTDSSNVQSVSDSFDQETIKKLEQLGATSNDTSLPSGRISPFTE